MRKRGLRRKTRALSLRRVAVAAAAAGPVKQALLMRLFPKRLLTMSPRTAATTKLKLRQSRQLLSRLLKSPRPQPFLHHPHATHAIAAIRAIEVAMDVAANAGADEEIVNNNQPSQICCAKDRRYSSRLPRSLSPKKARASLRISRCPDAF